MNRWRAVLDLLAPVFHGASRLRGVAGPSTSPAAPPEVIRAAGGLVWRSTPEGRKVAVIHRRRYGDWTLPKGKLRPGESLREAALREVREETGCDATIGDLAGVLRYEVKGIPKVVVFWNMELTGEGSFRPSEEVEEIAWLLPEKAMGVLDYPGERDLLAGQAGLPRPRERCRRWWSRARRRLAASLQVARVEIEQRAIRCAAQADGPVEWVAPSLELLARADRALAYGDLDAGWSYLHAAWRTELAGLDAVELGARASAVRHEAAGDKFGSWRRDAILAAVGKAEQALAEAGPRRVAEAGAHLAEALLLRGEAFSNTYYRVGLLRTQLALVYAVALATLVAVLLVNPLAEGAGPGGWRHLAGVLLFGALGAAFSAILSLARTTARRRIPEQIVDSRVTVLRPALGAMAALVAYVFLQARILDLGTMGTLKTLAISFVAGFSDQLVTRAAESVAGGGGAEGRTPAGKGGGGQAV